ncbi:MAG: hypothetical protein WA971_11805 [Microbacterium sp.]
MDEDVGAGRRGAWVLVILAAAVVAASPFVLGGGACYDAHEGGSAESYCTSGPFLGWPGTWVLVALCALAAGFAVFRLIRPRRA